MTPRRFVIVKTPRHVFVAGSFAVVIAIIATTAIASGDRDVVRPTEDFTAAEPYEQLPTGAATSRKPINANAFSHSSANMSFERELAFKVGNGFFRRIWVSAPSSTKAADGLGPLFNAKSCQRCHLKDGRGHPPNGNWPVDNAVSMVLRLSIPPQTEEHRALLDSGRANVIPEPTYGGQLQDFAIQGHKAEGRMQMTALEKHPANARSPRAHASPYTRRAYAKTCGGERKRTYLIKRGQQMCICTSAIFQ